jgi:hypothetical protein
VIFDVFAAGRVPQPHGAPVLATESPRKPVVFPVTRVCVGPAVEVTDGKDRLLVGGSANPAVVIEYIGSAPSSVLGIAVPNPLLVQGDGTGRKDVAGLA